MDETEFNSEFYPDDFEYYDTVPLKDFIKNKFYYVMTKRSNLYWGKIKYGPITTDRMYYRITFEIYYEYSYKDDEWEKLDVPQEILFMNLEAELPFFYEIHPEGSADKPPISNSTKYISKGSYGLTLRPALPNKKNNGTWEQYNNSITKLFFNKHNMNNAFVASAQVKEYTGNEGHKAYLYKHPYKFNNLSYDFINDLSDTKVLKYLGNTLYPMRMPNLGVNISTLNKPDKYLPLRKIPTTIMLQQIKKVLSQVNTFIEKGKIHADIREPNLMINAKTGVITIIDFDFFSDATKFLRGDNVAFYNRPPENYFYCNFLKRTTSFLHANYLLGLAQSTNKEENNAFITNIISSDNKLISDATESGRRKYDLKLYMKDNNRFIFREELGLKLSDRVALIDVIRKNVTKMIVPKKIIDESSRIIFENVMIRYFDGFGLASSLLDLLVASYSKYTFDPKYTMGESIAAMKELLDKKVEKADAGAGVVTYERYTDNELKQIYKAIQCVFYLVLLPMVSLDITTRLSVRGALIGMNEIIAAYDKPIELNAIHAEAVSRIKLGLEATANRKLDIVVKVNANNTVNILPASNKSKSKTKSKSKSKSKSKTKSKSKSSSPK